MQVGYARRFINYARELATQVNTRERDRARARAMVRGKGQAKVRAMDPGLRPELG